MEVKPKSTCHSRVAYLNTESPHVENSSRESGGTKKPDSDTKFKLLWAVADNLL